MVGLTIGDGTRLADLASDGGEVRHVAAQIVRDGLVLHGVDAGPGNGTATVRRHLVPVLLGEGQHEMTQEKVCRRRWN